MSLKYPHKFSFVLQFFLLEVYLSKNFLLMKFFLILLALLQHSPYQRYPLILFKDFSEANKVVSKFSINKIA